MKDFILVKDDMPSEDPNFKTLSITVNCQLKDGSVTRGFYDRVGDIWYTGKGKLKDEVIAWHTLEKDENI